VEQVSDKARLRELLGVERDLHIYELGDLDDFFWPRTRWFVRGGAVVLLYDAPGLPVVVGLGGDPELPGLLAALQGTLPARVYAHLSPGLAAAFAPRFGDQPHGAFAKYALARPALGPDDPGCARLGPGDRAELEAFYAAAYPGNWFDPRMLETGQYVALRQAGAIVAAGGVHVYSPAEGVAALGNIAVAPDRRGAGLGRRVTAAVCRSLRASVARIGLNVRADNAAAIACYQRLGFRFVAPYEEHLFQS